LTVPIDKTLKDKHINIKTCYSIFKSSSLIHKTTVLIDKITPLIHETTLMIYFYVLTFSRILAVLREFVSRGIQFGMKL